MQKGRDALEAQCQRLREEVGGLQSELRRVKQHSDALQRAQDRAGAASPERGAGAASPSRDGAAAADLQAQAAALREKLAASRRGERHLERALAAAEAREAAAAAQAAALEGAVAGHDALAARLQVLQGRADDAAAERARATRYQEVRQRAAHAQWRCTCCLCPYRHGLRRRATDALRIALAMRWLVSA